MTDTPMATGLVFENSFAKQLDGFYAPFGGDKTPDPRLVKFNSSLASELGFSQSAFSPEAIANMFAGGTPLHGSVPIAQAYAGHQFGGFNPQLGDGRALLLGEVRDASGALVDIHLKGSGRTAYSRGGDGKAALAPVLREYILGEAMHALGIPTTRGLAAVTTGETVWRDKVKTGAVLARVASSHIRVGSFQYFAARGDMDKVKQLADYTIARHFPELAEAENPYLGLLTSVCDRQALLLAKWMLVGFVHGVMNTDNMTISGETIDYGPCAFIDAYDPMAVFSSIDQQARYAYENQPKMAQWNLARLAETLLPLIHSDGETAVKLATEKWQAFNESYQAQWLQGMRAKLGLLLTQEQDDMALAQALLKSMQYQKVDFTQLFRGLAQSIEGDAAGVRGLFDDTTKFDVWYLQWQARLARDPSVVAVRVAAMNGVNPVYIPRNHLLEEALTAAEESQDYTLFEALMRVLAKPFDEQKNCQRYAEGAPASFAHYQTFCGT